MKDAPYIWAAWDIGDFTGDRKISGYVTVEPAWSLHLEGNNRWFQSLTGAERVEIEVPNIKSINVDRAIDTDAASCAITMYNTFMADLNTGGGTPAVPPTDPIPEVLGERYGAVLFGAQTFTTPGTAASYGWTTLTGRTAPTATGGVLQATAGSGAWVNTGVTGDREITFDFIYDQAIFFSFGNDSSNHVTSPFVADQNWLNNSTILRMGQGIAPHNGGIGYGTSGAFYDTLAAAVGDTVHVAIRVEGSNIEYYFWKNAETRPVSPSGAEAISVTDGPYFSFESHFFTRSMDNFTVTQILDSGIAHQNGVPGTPGTPAIPPAGMDTLGQPGYYSPGRGASPEAMARWNQAMNAWSTADPTAAGQALAPMSLLRTYQGYGAWVDGSPMTWAAALAGGYVVITGTWIVDTVTVGSNGILSLKCRDSAKLLIDQFSYPPIAPASIYPIKFARWEFINVDEEWDATAGDTTVGVDTIVPLTYTISTVDFFGGFDADVDGHHPSQANDGDTATYYLSGGTPTSGAGNGYEYVEYSMTGSINRVTLHAWGGPYQYWISVRVNGVWQGVSTDLIPYNFPTPDIANTIVNFVSTGGIAAEQALEIVLPTTYQNADRVRVTLNDVQPYGPGPDSYRSGIREFAGRLHTTQTIFGAGSSFAMARYPGGDGFWVVGATGLIYSLGDAPAMSVLNQVISQNVIAAEEWPAQKGVFGWGLWTLQSNGKVNSIDGFGDGAGHYGDIYTSTDPLAQIAVVSNKNDFVDMASTRTGNGYWVLERDGTVWAFGDAVHHGNMTATGTLNAIFGVGTAATAQRIGVAIASDPTGDGYWIVNRLGEVRAFAGTSITAMADFPQAMYPVTPTGAAEFREVVSNNTGTGLWGLWDTGAITTTGTGVPNFGDATAAFIVSDSFRTNFWSMSKTNTDAGYRLLQTNGNIFYFGDAHDFGSLATGSQRLPGNYTDYSQIVIQYLLWAGFLLFGTTGVHGNIETTGAWSEEKLTEDVFDKKSVMDIITMLKEIVGYIFYVDDEGGVHFESPNWFTIGNHFEDGTATTFVPSIDESFHLINYSAQLDDSQLRSEVVIANDLPFAGNVGTVVTRTTPAGASTLRGMQKPAIWTNEVFLNVQEQQIMAQLVGMHIFFSMRTGSVECIGNPCIQLNDQVRIFERISAETYIHYVRSISTNMDLDTGVYKMSITTNWLGDETMWAINRVSLP